jgi:hypothetical protein
VEEATLLLDISESLTLEKISELMKRQPHLLKDKIAELKFKGK